MSVPPSEIVESPIVILEFAKDVLGIFERPKVIVPDDVIGDPESTSMPSVPLIATDVTVPVVVE